MRRIALARRRGFTLVELLVAVAIIIALAALTLLIVNASADKRAASRASDQLQGWVAIAKSRALRDQSPRGVRLIASGTRVSELVYIEQPDNYSPPPNTTLTVAANSTTVNFTATVTLTNYVAPGDMLQISSVNEPAHLITNVSANSVTLKTTVAAANGIIAPAVLTVPSGGYFFIPQPRPLMGEPPYQLPKSVYIDLSQSQNVTQSYTTGNYDILFSPSGQVLGAGGGRVILWVTDSNGPVVSGNSTALGEPVLLTIYTRTGGVAVQPVGPAGSPYVYTQDGFNSGL